MKTTFDVLNRLYKALNVTAVTSTLDTNGRVWRRKKPINRQNRDVVIVPLDLRNVEDVQPGTFIINIFAQNHPNGIPDETNLKTTGAAVIAALDGIEATDGTWFRTDVQNETVFQDEDDPAVSYLSIRVGVLIENV